MSEEELLACERRVWEAVVHQDGATLAECFSDSYMEITLDGKRVVKAAVVDESPQVDEIDRYAIDCVKYVALSSDIGMLNYHLVLDGRCRGEALQPRDRWATSIWSRNGGVWQCSFFQQSPYS